MSCNWPNKYMRVGATVKLELGMMVSDVVKRKSHRAPELSKATST